MIAGKLSRAAETVEGRLAGPDAAFRGVSTDSRTLATGELFIALRGPNFDGGQFVGAAAAGGAAGAVVETRREAALPQIEVGDTLKALGRLAADWRRQMPARIVGLTGSNGKTTLKELIASCLSRQAPTLATAGNLNNEIGVPLMLCRLAAEHRYAVIEMGANHAGEIARLTDLVSPHVVAITNAGTAHLEGFGSVDGVAQAKGEILSRTPRPEVAVLNADDRYFGFWQTMSNDVRMLSFGFDARADVRVLSAEPTAAGAALELNLCGTRIDVALPLQGRHNAANAAAAAAVCLSLGLAAGDIRAGLAAATPVAGRLRVAEGIGGIRVFDDSYNANPSSVTAAAEFLGAQPGSNWLVLGDMAELGSDAGELHRDVGRAARTAGVTRLFATGTHMRAAIESFGADGRWYESVEALIEGLLDALATDEPPNVLVKGSRSMRMERVVAALVPSDDGGSGA